MNRPLFAAIALIAIGTYAFDVVGVRRTLRVAGGGGSANSITFDGADDYFEIDTYPSSLAGDEFSLSFWFNAHADTASNDTIMHSDDGTNSHVSRVWFDSALKVNIKYSNSTNVIINSVTANLDDGNWHHILFTYDSGRATEAELYLDGVLKSSSSTGSGDLSALNQDPYVFGSWNTGLLYHFKGKLYDVVMAESILDLSDVYDSGSPVAIADATHRFFWSGDNVSGGTLTNGGTDSSDATLTNGATSDSDTP